MRLLIVHHAVKYFAGAEKVLGYYLEALVKCGAWVAVAAVPGSRTAGIIPVGAKLVPLPENERFSPLSFLAQVRAIRAAHRDFSFDVIHGWAARDWELVAVAGKLCGRPAIGTLHDHPEASFISIVRRRLMRWSAAGGLRRVVCVSEAVRVACANAGYSAGKLVVVHNGLPAVPVAARSHGPGACRLGFLGIFSERKGIRGLFSILSELARLTTLPWEIKLAGGPAGGPGELMMAELREQYCQAVWWPRVQWCGWVENPSSFLSTVDILLVPSNEFDPLPTVLLEAGQLGVPAVAARVGGVAEIVDEGQTGWLFESGDWAQAARILAGLLAAPPAVRLAGDAARGRIAAEFPVPKMVAQYRELYSSTRRHGH